VTAQAVIFDIGNVLVRWEPRLLFRQLLPDEAAVEDFLAEIGFAAWNLEQDRGRSWDEGVALLSTAYPHRAPLITAFVERWHETLPGLIDGSVAILEELRAGGVPLYAITNYSGKTWAETVARFPRLRAAFRDVVVSAHERVVKPDPAIYRICLERNGLRADEVVFIDDSEANVAGAAALGIDAIRFTDPPALRAALQARGLLPQAARRA